MRRFAKGVLATILVIACAVLALKGSVLVLQSGSWSQTGILSNPRVGASAATLPDGRILIAGGDPGNGPTASVDFFNTDGTISAASPMMYARSKQVSVALQDGRILVAGGVTAGGSATNTAEIFDPIAQSWSSVALGMIEARSGATAAVLQDGRVLVAGGQNGTAVSSTLEIFDPVANAFSAAGMMSSPRSQHAMAVLPDGRVLIVGGNNGTAPDASTSIFDPVAGTVSAGPALNIARYGHSATTLLNGMVVVIGGNNGNANSAQMDVTPVELFDPTANTFSTLATNLTTPREGHLAILLPNNNRVLIAGGTSAGAAVASAELFTSQESTQAVWTYGFGSTGSMTAARSGAADSANQVNAPSTKMQRNGIVAVAGGSDANGNALNTAEAYGYPTVQTDQSDYPPGTTVTITGSGFQAGEAVTIQLVESPVFDTHGPYTVQADANGNFVDTSFATDEHDLNIRFYLTATGQTSGFLAQNTFTDSKPNSVNVGTQSTNPVAPGSSTGYTVTIDFNGNNAACTANLSVTSALPTGATASFSPSSVTSMGADQTSTLTISTTNATPPGSTNFTVQAAGTAPNCNGNNATNTGTLVVVENTTTTLTSSVNPSTFGQSTTLTATVAKVTGPATPTGGTVTFKDGATTLGTGTLTAGVVTLSTSALTVAGSPHSLTASYDGVANTFGASTSNTVTQTVNQASTSTTLTSSANPSVFGQSVTFTATVGAVVPGAGTIPAGESVTFKDGATSIGTGTTNASGVATFATSALTVATHSITAVYAGDTNFATSTSGAVSQVVNRASTSTTLTSSANPSVFGQSVTFTATVGAVAPGAGTIPAGETVTFKDGATSIGTGTTNASGVATFATSALTVATHSITAVYAGDTNFATSTSGAVPQVVNQASTSTALTSSLNPSVFSQSVTFTATVTVNSPSTGTIPAGESVTFKDGATSIGTGTTNASGVATFATSALTVATHSITAVYAGDTNFSTSTSTAVSQVVNKRATTTSVGLSLSTVVVGQASSATVTVTDTDAGTQTNPTGTVTLSSSDTGDTFGTCTLAPSGGNAATCTATVTPSKVGTSSHTITATFPPDTTHATSNGAALLTVNPRTTSTSITLNPASVLVGQASTITVTVTDTSSTGTQSNPGGTIAFSSPDLNDTFTTCMLANSGTNAATCTATVTPKDTGTSPRSITATYTPTDNAHSTSNSAAALTVSARTTSTSISLNPSSVGVGQTSTITVTVTDTSSTGTQSNPGGTIAFSSPDTNDTFTTCTLANSGGNAATCTATVTPHDLGTSPRSITAAYTPADNVHSGSNGPASLTVTQPDLIATKTDSVGGSTTVGNSWTWNITVKNVGTGSANFTANNQVILTDNLPSANITYANVIPGNFVSVSNSGQIGCSIIGTTLTCVQSGNGQFVSIAAGGSFTVQITATPSAAGTFANPASSGTCEVDPNNNVGESNLANNFCSDTVTVTAANTSTTITSTSATSGFVGQPVTVNFKVTNTSGAAVAPTGTVTVTDGTGDSCSGTLTTGAGGASTGSCNLTPTTTGTKTLVASFPASTNFNASSSTGTTYTVTTRSTSTTVTLTPSSVSVNGSSTVSVTVADTSGTGSTTPAGTVSFSSSDTGAKGDTFNLASCTLVSGACSMTVTTHEVGTGSHTISGTYTPNDGVHATSNNSATLTVTAGATSTTLASSLNPSFFGQQVTFTATVSSASGTPTGTVNFFDGATQIGSGTLAVVGGNDVATFSTSTLTVGTHTITAVYVSDGNFSGSTSNAVSQVVNSATTSTSVTSSANPSVFGQAVSFNATVTPQQSGLGTPTGTMQFAIDSVAFGSPVTLDASGSATSALTSSLSVGPHTITATYTPASGSVYLTSTATLTQNVNEAATQTMIMSSPNPSTFGQTVMITVTVAPIAPGTGTPTGSVAIAIDGSPSTLTLIGGSATVSTSALTAGSHTITAAYTSDGSFATSMASTTQMVTQAATSFSNLSTSQTIPFGTASIMLSGTISAFGPIYPPTTENVKITINGVTVSTPIGANGGFSTSFDTHAIMASITPYTITYSYAGDTNFTAASDSSTSLTVNAANTQTSVVSATNPSVLGQAVAFTATVTDASSGDTAIPNGNVAFFDGTTLIGGAALNPSGNATFTTSLLSSSASPHSITAAFLGNADFSPSTSSAAISQVVGARSTTTTAAVSPTQVVIGQASAVTLTVTDTATTGPAGSPGVFATTSQSLNVGRTGHAAALLPNGTVLVVGGENASSTVLTSGEIYDPSIPAFTTTANSLNTGRTGATATLLPNGKVLIAGGSSDSTASGALSSAEVFDPIAGTFTPLTATLTTPRFGDTATLLLSTGKVLIAGGQNSTGTLNSMEVYDPNAQTFTGITDTLSVARAGDTATLLYNGTILFAGGSGLSSAEIYDPVAHTSTATGNMTTDRMNHAAALLPDGNVLIAGGTSSGNAVTSSELYNTAAGTFTLTGNTQMARSRLTATMLDTAQVLLVGGSNSGIAALASAELYTPSFDPLGTVAVSSSDNSDSITLSPCALTLNGKGATTCQVNDTPALVGSGTRTLTGTYSPAPDAVHTGSSGTTTLTVAKADTTTTVTPSVNPSIYGQSVTFTAMVGVVAPGSGAPTGTVDFKDGSNTLASGVGLSAGQATFTTSSLSAATHSITAVYSGDTNFNATGADAGSTATALTQTVNPAVLMVTANPQTKVYGQSDPALTYTVTGFQLTDTAATVLTGALTRAPGETVAGSPYAITQGTLTANSNYTILFTGSSLTITPATLYITANPQTKVYGQPDPTLTYTATGFQFMDTAATVLTGALTRAAGESVAGSPYAITQGTLTANSNYTIHFTGSSLTITPATLTITANPQTKVYGQPDPTLTYMSSGFQFSDTAATVLTGALTRAPGETVAGSPYAITQGTLAANSNYKIAFTSSSLTITPATLTITANPQTKVYGQPDPTLTYMSSGFQFSDTAATVLTGALTRAPGEIVVGSPYAITQGTLTANSNYKIAFTASALTINPAPLTITASSATMNYGATVPLITASYSGFVNGDTPASLNTPPVCTTPAHGPPSGSPVGSFPTNCSGAVDSNYIISYTPGTVTIVAVPLTITASSGPMIYGGPVFPVAPMYSGFVNGDAPASLTTQPSCGTTATSLSPVSGSPYVSFCSGASDTNYTVSYMSGLVTVLQASTTTAVVSSVNPSTFMQLVTFTATVTPQFSGTTPTGTVTFYNNGSSIGTGTLSVLSCGTPPCPDQASFSIANLPDSGPDNITATYGGDTNFTYSTSPAFTQTVQPAPNVNLNPMYVSFGNQNVNTTSKAATVTLANIGDAPLNISTNGISIAQTSTDFAQTNNCGSSVAAGKSCTISITFTPVDTGIRTATLQITDNDDDATGAVQYVSLTGAGLSTITGGSLYTNAIFATANGCGSIVMSGGSTVDSFNSASGYGASHQLSGGNVGTNGNVTLNGNKSAIYGSAAVDSVTTGSCSKTSVTGITSNGGAQVTGGPVALNGPVNYPAAPTPSPAPPTTAQNISGSCGSISGCTNNGTKNVSLAPGQYGNLNISGGTTAHFRQGTYNINSLTLSGQSILYVDSGPVLVNLAGASLSGGTPTMDATGGSFQNPSGIPANLQFTYAGSRGINLSGGADSYATVYAPNALVNMSGGTDFFGSIIASTVTNSGGTAVHYDTSLPSISAGNFIWFNAVVNDVNGLPANNSQVKLYLTNSTINFTANGTPYSINVPNAVVTFNSVSTLKTTYDLTNSRWSTSVPKGDLTGNTFVTGVAFQVPANFPTGIQNVAWSASYSTDTPGITLQWQWGAAVYSTFSATYATSSPANSNVLGVNAEDGSVDINGTDPAGTPEVYKGSLAFGATGGGLTNYTGYLTPGAGVVPTVAPMSVSPSSLDFGNQAQGALSASMTTVLTNNDSASHNISGILLGGTDVGDFTLVSGGVNNCISMTSLASGASCNLYVTFTPSDVGTRTARIAVNDDANNSPQTVYLTGTGQ